MYHPNLSDPMEQDIDPATYAEQTRELWWREAVDEMRHYKREIAAMLNALEEFLPMNAKIVLSDFREAEGDDNALSMLGRAMRERS